MENRFIDNQDGTITDTLTTLMWTREDLWQRDAKWVTWDEAMDYARDLAGDKFARYQDWRLPTIKEAMSLYQAGVVNKDKYEKEIHINPVFPEGPQACIWCDEPQAGHDGFIVDYRNGEVRTLYKSKCPRMSARGVRGEMVED